MTLANFMLLNEVNDFVVFVPRKNKSSMPIIARMVFGKRDITDLIPYMNCKVKWFEIYKDMISVKIV